MSGVRPGTVFGSAPDVCIGGVCGAQLSCLCPCCGDNNHVQDVFILRPPSRPTASRPFLTKAIPTLVSAGDGAAKVGATLPQLAQAQVMVACPLSMQCLVFPCKQQQTEEAQCILVNLRHTVCSWAQRGWHRAAHTYFKFFYPSKMAGSIQTVFWGWCLAHTNTPAVLCFVGVDPHARDHSNRSPAQIIDSVPRHHLAIGKENLD